MQTDDADMYAGKCFTAEISHTQYQYVSNWLYSGANIHGSIMVEP